MQHILYLDNDNAVEVIKLRDRADTVISAATVDFTLLDSLGAEVAGATWPQAMTPTGIAGGYDLVLDKAVAIVENALYTGRIVVDGGAGKDGGWDLEYKAARRKG